MTAMPPGSMLRLVQCVRDVDPEKLELAANYLGSPDCDDPDTFWVEFDGRLTDKILHEICDAWQEAGAVSGSDVGIVLRTAAFVSQQDEETRLVATLPWIRNGQGQKETDSEQAYINVIKHAKARLVVATYVFYETDQILPALKAASDRGVSIEVLVELPSSQGGNAKFGHDNVAVVRKHLPRAKVYCRDANAFRAAHAKFVCSDGMRAFVTSANLTNAALGQNLEVGVLVVGGAIPRQVLKLFDTLVTRKVIIPA